jgi:Aerotolerance regulator N-terminal/von Willebrand factor type A domain
MDFANGLYLWGLLAGALPILLHLYFKRRKKRVQFSTLLFFVKKERLFAFRRKLYEILLLLLRVIILILLALALSRMFFKRFNFITGGGTEAVIIIDDSLSMQRQMISGRTAYNYGQKQAEKILNSLSGDDGAAVIFTSGADGVNLTRDKSLVLKTLRRAKLSAVPGSLSAALQKASEQLRRSPGVNREIYIISDFAKNNTPLHALSIRKLKNSRLYCLPLHGSNENISVSAGKLDSVPKIIKRGVNIPFKLTNHGKLTRKITAELKISGKVVQTKLFSLAPQAVLSEVFVYIPQHSGRVQACVEIDDENILLDNRAWFSFAVADKLNVLLVSNQKGQGADPFYFFRTALNPSALRPLNGIRCEAIDRNLLDKDILAKQHVVCLALDKPLTAHYASILANYMYSGGILITVPQAESKENYLDALIKQNKLMLHKTSGKILSVRNQGVKFNPPLRELNDLLQLKLVRWRKLVDFQPSSAKVLAQSDSARPLILEQRAGKGKLLSLGFALRRNFSNWPSLKSYPVAMVAFINYAAGNQEKSISSYCGGMLELEGENIIFSSTSGKNGIFKANSKQYSRQPGILTFEGANQQAAVFNPAPTESKTATAMDSELRKWFNAPLTVLNVNSDIISQIVKFRKGSELTGWILLLMLLLLGVEFMLSGKQSMMKKAIKKQFKPGDKDV